MEKERPRATWCSKLKIDFSLVNLESREVGKQNSLTTLCHQAQEDLSTKYAFLLLFCNQFIKIYENVCMYLFSHRCDRIKATT